MTTTNHPKQTDTMEGKELLNNKNMKKRKFPIKPNKCLSTHGGSGFVIGSYMENGYVVCGECGTKIKRPQAVELANNSEYIGGSRRSVRNYEQNSKKWYQFWK